MTLEFHRTALKQFYLINKKENCVWWIPRHKTPVKHKSNLRNNYQLGFPVHSASDNLAIKL